MIIYTASKTKHAHIWRDLRSKGYHINSTWIDEAEQGESKCLIDLWQRCIDEASSADYVLCYREEGDILKGAFIEVGAALAFNKRIFTIGCEEFSFINHPNVYICSSIEDALAMMGF